MDQLVINVLNGLSAGLLLFLLSSGLTLIFSMMGVLNFAHASFYMLGAYIAHTLAGIVGFWAALVAAPLLVGAMGAAAAGRVYMVAYSHSNMGGETGKLAAEFKSRYNEDWYVNGTYTTFSMLSTAMARAKSTDPVKVAAAMQGLKFKGFDGEVEMRKSDHQLQQGLYIAVWQKADAKFPYSVENTGYTFAPVKAYEPWVASTPTTCQMKAPT